MADTSELHPMVNKLLSIVADSSIWHETFSHEAVRTSEEAADTRPGYLLQQGAKAILVKVKPRGQQKKFCMLVFPADLSFNNKKTKDFFDAKELRFASEAEVAEITENILPGGVPPFGNLFGLDVFVDKQLLDEETIVFNAGDRRFSLAIRVSDYIELVKPTICDIASVREHRN